MEDRAAIKIMVDTFSIPGRYKEIDKQVLLFTEDAESGIPGQTGKAW